MKTLTLFAAMLIFSWFTIGIFANFVVTPITLEASPVPGHYAPSIYGFLNKLELFFGLTVSTILFFSYGITWRKALFILSLIPLVIVLSYVFYLTPSLADIGEMVTTTKANSEQLGYDYHTIKSEHAFYHQKYVFFDGVKLLSLTLLSCLMLFSLSDEKTG